MELSPEIRQNSIHFRFGLYIADFFLKNMTLFCSNANGHNFAANLCYDRWPICSLLQSRIVCVCFYMVTFYVQVFGAHFTIHIFLRIFHLGISGGTNFPMYLHRVNLNIFKYFENIFRAKKNSEIILIFGIKFEFFQKMWTL